MTTHSICHIGKQRDNNEDAVAVCQDLHLIILADGMGGANAGEVASSLTIQTVENHFRNNLTPEATNSQPAIYDFMRQGIQSANSAIMQHVAEHPEAEGLGTTVVILWVIDDKAHIAWCGDSRCYCYNPATGLNQLTHDHSYVQQLVDEGKLTPDEAFNHPDGNIITNCLGDVDADCQPDFVTHPIDTDDLLILCSDGLCGYCTDEYIQKTIESNYPNPANCLDALFQIAMNAGGEDNISIAVCTNTQQPAANTGGIAGFLKKLFMH